MKYVSIVIMAYVTLCVASKEYIFPAISHFNWSHLI